MHSPTPHPPGWRLDAELEHTIVCCSRLRQLLRVCASCSKSARASCWTRKSCRIRAAASESSRTRIQVLSKHLCKPGPPIRAHTSRPRFLYHSIYQFDDSLLSPGASQLPCRCFRVPSTACSRGRIAEPTRTIQPHRSACAPAARDAALIFDSEARLVGWN